MFKTITTTALLAAITSPAAANHFGDLFQHVALVRGQMTLVEAQASATFHHLPRGRRLADDIYDELEDLCRDLDRFERELQRPIATRGQLRRLERYAERIDDQACEVREAIVEALDDANRRFGRHARVRRVPVLHDHRHRTLSVPHHPANRLAVYPGVTTRRVSINLGGVRLSFGDEPRVTAIPQRQFVGRTAPIRHTALRPHVAPAAPCVAPGQAAVLLAQADHLRLLTKQLLACACN